MHKSFAVLSVLTSVALAQTLVPTNITGSCSSFLNQLNQDTTLGDCTSALVSATSGYAPGSDATKNPSTAQVNSTLSGLCAASIDEKCSDSLVGEKLTAFYSACSQELTSNPNEDVIRNYDVLYSIVPFRTALCSMDDTSPVGNYCVTQSKLPTDGSTLQKILTLSSTNLVLPNATTIRDSSLLYLFTQATSSSSDLCTSCTRKIMNAYTSFEGKIPYASGLAKSQFLSTQTSLYTSIQGTCGQSFLSEAGVVKAAGGLAGGTLSGGALQVSPGSSFVFASMGGFLLLILSAL